MIKETAMDMKKYIIQAQKVLSTLLMTVVVLSVGQVQGAQQDDVVLYLNDSTGTAVADIPENGKLCWEERFSPYGDKTVMNDSYNYNGCGAVSEERGITGHSEDTETELVYMQHRFCDPTIGRFLSPDPVDPVVGNIHQVNRYVYAGNNPYKFKDPNGDFPVHFAAYYAVTAALSLYDTYQAYKEGGLKGAALQLAVDATLSAVGGRTGAKVLDNAIDTAGDAARRLDDVPKGEKGLEIRGFKPAPSERTIQGQVDVATQSGNPTIQRGGQDFVRLRSSGHGQAGATATPQNVVRTDPTTGERFGPQAGPDRAVTPSDIREHYKAQAGQGTSIVCTRNGR